MIQNLYLCIMCIVTGLGGYVMQIIREGESYLKSITNADVYPRFFLTLVGIPEKSELFLSVFRLDSCN